MATLFGLPPVWMAPMAGEAASATLVAAVSAAGGFGQLGAAYLAPSRIVEVAADIRARTGRPFGINLFCTHPGGATTRGRTPTSPAWPAGMPSWACPRPCGPCNSRRTSRPSSKPPSPRGRPSSASSWATPARRAWPR